MDTTTTSRVARALANAQKLSLATPGVAAFEDAAALKDLAAALPDSGLLHTIASVLETRAARPGLSEGERACRQQEANDVLLLAEVLEDDEVAA